MNYYLLINVFIIIVPLSLSFEGKIRYYRKLPALGLSILIAAGIFIIWDSIAVMRGDWSFNPAYVSGYTLFSLPPEELLFFITVPYSCIFIYENIRLYIPEKEVKFSRYFTLSLALLFLILSLSFYKRYYTFTVLLFCSAIFWYFFFSNNILQHSMCYWIFIIVSYVPFLAVNYVLTALPIVIYNPSAITGQRVYTIPIEDFFYSFSLLTTYLIIYTKAGAISEDFSYWSRTWRANSRHKSGVERS